MKPKHSCVLSNLQKAGSNNRILYPGCRCLLYLFVKNWSRLLSTHLLQQKFRMQILCIILCPQILSRDNNLLLCYRKSGCRILCIFFCPKILGRLLSAYLHTPAMLGSGSHHVGPESLPFHDEERR